MVGHQILPFQKKVKGSRTSRKRHGVRTARGKGMWKSGKRLGKNEKYGKSEGEEREKVKSRRKHEGNRKRKESQIKSDNSNKRQKRRKVEPALSTRKKRVFT